MTIAIRPLAEADLPAASRINRAAFSVFFGIPDPAKFRVDADVIGPRWRLWREAGLALDLDGALAGVALMMRWGSVCVLGPVTVAPEHWSKGFARLLMTRLIGHVDRSGFALTGLFTHPQSPKHIRLYESYGFRMQRITAVMMKPVVPASDREPASSLAALDTGARVRARAGMTALTGAIFPGLDVSDEAEDVAAFGLGDTLLLGDAAAPDAFAICHHGSGSEASQGQVLVKFAAARGGAGGEDRFRRMLAACEAFAARRGAAQLVAGTNTGRAEAYEIMQGAGFRTTMNGIAMTRPDNAGYNRPGAFVVDDWR